MKCKRQCGLILVDKKNTFKRQKTYIFNRYLHFLCSLYKKLILFYIPCTLFVRICEGYLSFIPQFSTVHKRLLYKGMD